MTHGQVEGGQGLGLGLALKKRHKCVFVTISSNLLVFVPIDIVHYNIATRESLTAAALCKQDKMLMNGTTDSVNGRHILCIRIDDNLNCNMLASGDDCENF
jgi:hypothetical protein